MTQRAEIDRLVEPIARELFIARSWQTARRGDWDDADEDEREPFYKLARAVLQSDALSGLIKREEELREALPTFERVTRLAHTLASDVPITASARQHIEAAYERLNYLSNVAENGDG